MIVCKFGGKTTTSIEAIKNVQILKKQNTDRVVFVFSAIGKENSGDEKTTDILIKCAQQFKKKKNTQKYFDKIINKFQKLQKNTNVNINLQKEINKIKNKFFKNKDKNYLISRGEYLTSLIMSKYLNLTFVPAEKIIFFKNKKINTKKTYKKLKYYLKKYKKIVIPGFYGIDQNKNIKLFSRGGGDITGAIIAKLLNFSVYENWTDIAGIKQINPKLKNGAKQIKQISYSDVFLMTNYDTKVIHKDCAKYLKDSNTLIKVNSIFDIYSRPTIICNHNYKDNCFVVYKKIDNKYFVVVKTNKSSQLLKKYQNYVIKQKDNIIKLVFSSKNFLRNILNIYENYGG